MKPKRSVALAVVIPALLIEAVVMAACGSDAATTTQAVTTTTEAPAQSAYSPAKIRQGWCKGTA